MEDKVLDFLKNNNKALTLIEIADALNCNDSLELEELQKTVNKLVLAGEVHETKKNKYLLMKYCDSLKNGELSITEKGYGFLLCTEGEDIYISKDNLGGAINGDVVLIDTFIKNNKLEGKVLKILKRDLKKVIGIIHVVNDKYEVELDNKKLDLKIELSEVYYNNLVDGHKVLVELTKEIKPKVFVGTIVKVIGHINDPDIDILSIAAEHGIELEFSEEVMEEVRNIPDEVSDKDKIGRVDLTKEEIFTIDGDDTKDIDDAISIKFNNDIYELGVHIADVSYYVRPGTKLYDAAYERGTSSYLADRVLPMLPHELSNGICSLNPNVERLAISCVMNIDLNGKIQSYDIFPSIIKSRKQMTYKKVNKLLMEDIVEEGYEEYADSLLKMRDLAKILRKRLIDKGYIEFDIPEAKIVQDETGKCIDIIKREQQVGENLIEEFMVAANECVATHINNMDLPFIYRIHGKPKQEKIDDFLNMLKILNINVNTRNISTTPRSMQSLLKELENYKEHDILSSMLLRSMQKAIYSKDNIGHFGLGLQNYTHFTSPIRRFPDTTVHQLLRTYLFNKDINSDIINYYENYLVEVAEHSSEREQAAVDAEREVVDLKMAEYMEDHIGEVYEGIITTVTNFGFFVELPNLVEGLVHVNSLNGFYNYNEDLLSLIGPNKKKYTIGDQVKIIVTNANKSTRMIDFEVFDGDN